jgi:hypothetical protein
MITENLVKNAFIAEVLTEDLDSIKAQQLVRINDAPMSTRKRFDIPAISTGIEQQIRTVASSPDGVLITLLIDRRLRYLDMRRLGNLPIYNKVFFPLIYRHALPRIHYAFTQQVRQRLHDRLSDAFN